MTEPQFLTLNWPAPASVRALITTRNGGVSAGPWQGFNLAGHVGDDPSAVCANRTCLMRAAGLDTAPLWLQQVHGTKVVAADDFYPEEPAADASTSRTAGRACVVMTADCLPVLFCNRGGTEVAAAHAGWRGLAAGILRSTVAAMQSRPSEMLAYLGPAISQPCFEVGQEVKLAMLENALDAEHRLLIEAQFLNSASNSQKLLADIYGLARAELQAVGVTAIFGGNWCSFRQSHWFYSFRRDGITGRMASIIWLTQ